MKRSSAGTLLSVGIALWLTGPARSEPTKPIDPRNSDPECALPFTLQGFAPSDAYNDYRGYYHGDYDYRRGRDRFSVEEWYRFRYLVADLNTLAIDAGGQPRCRGVEESYPDESAIPELRNPASRAHYHSQVRAFLTPPVAVAPEHELGGRRYCTGQRLSVCELTVRQDSVLVRRVARFAVSGLRATDSLRGFYAPLNEIKQRAWSSDRKYTEADYHRDLVTGGGKGPKVTVYRSQIELPNFLRFEGVNGFSGHPDTGIHESTRAAGKSLASLLGTPVSLGCLRVSGYAAKFLRWYLPRGARVFVRADEDRYRTYAPP